MNALKLIAGIAALVAAGCSSTTTITVPVGPRVDLSSYRSIGLVTFASRGADGHVENLCTRQFLEALQAAQPGTRVLELGPESQVLSSIDRRSWDPQALRAVKETHGVDVLVLGRFDMEEAKPDIQLSTLFKTLSVQATVDAHLSAKLVETETGATMWTDSAQVTREIARAHFNNRGQGHFGAEDAEAAHGEMIGCLVDEITDDFRMQYITKRVPKEQLAQQAASASE